MPVWRHALGAGVAPRPGCLCGATVWVPVWRHALGTLFFKNPMKNYGVLVQILNFDVYLSSDFLIDVSFNSIQYFFKFLGVSYLIEL